MAAGAAAKVARAGAAIGTAARTGMARSAAAGGASTGMTGVPSGAAPATTHRVPLVSTCF